MLLCPWGSPGKNTAVGCHDLLQEIFPTQGMNPRLLTLLLWQMDSFSATWEDPKRSEGVGLTEIFPFIHISAIWGPISCIFYTMSSSVLTIGSGCSLQVLFSFLGALRAQKFTFGRPESPITVTSLFTDTAGKTPFLNTWGPCHLGGLYLTLA